MTDNDKIIKLGIDLKIERKKQRITKAEMGQLTLLSQPTLDSLEAGKNSTLKTLQKYLTAIGFEFLIRRY